jgi:hypothetical protein
VAERDAGGRHREGLQVVEREPDAADAVVDVVLVVGVGRDAAAVVQAAVLAVAAEDVGAALGVDLGRREHDVAGRAHGQDQPTVVVGVVGVGLGELHVVGDHLRAGALELADQARMPGAPKRPPQVQVRERLVVDRHDDDVVRRRLGSADVEALVDAAELRAA